MAQADIDCVHDRIKPGYYFACAVCIEAYRPAIWLRFLENPAAPNWPVNLQGIVTVPRDYADFQGDWLR